MVVSHCASKAPSADGCDSLDKNVRAHVCLVVVEQESEGRFVLCGKEAGCELRDGGGRGKPALCPLCRWSIPKTRPGLNLWLHMTT